MDSIKFSDIRKELEKNLITKLTNSSILKDEISGFMLIEGFMHWTLRSEYPSAVVIGGPNVPIIGIVGNSTGRIYTFALKAIIPDIEERNKEPQNDPQ